jgi:type II secretory pathway pseudopilin PulG
MKGQNRQAAGFTLFGLTIVLVIIGLLMGGILTGQGMITQARIKNVVNDFNGTKAAYYSYRDRYRAVPGDDPNAATRWGSLGTSAGNGDGSLSGAYASAAPTDASRKFWWHLRAGDFIPGPTQNPGADVQPNDAVGGMIGVQNGGLGLKGLVICSSYVPDEVAAGVERQLDDERADQGKMRAQAHTVGGGPTEAVAATAPASSPYLETSDTRYILCVSA